MSADYLWMNGKIIPWENATVHVFSHALHYGSSVFEGIRAYEIGGQAALFRVEDHFKRLLFSCRTARIESPLTIEDWISTTEAVLRANKLKSAYVRPLVFRGYDNINLDGRTCPIEAILATVPWGTYLGEETLTNGIDAKVSSWRRISPGVMNPMAKIGGQYINGQNIVMEAKDGGFHEAIVLDSVGNICEGSGENIFLVCNNRILTPPIGSCIIQGITRDSVMTLAREYGYEVSEQVIPRETLHMADEIFMTGTAAELCPVRSVDRIEVGTGARGPVTEKLQKAFFNILQGKSEDRWNWLTVVEN